MKVQLLQPTAALYPAALKHGNHAATELQTIGNQQLLTTTKTAVLCSRQCPGEVILRLYDLARRLRTSDLTFIGGFHTPAERDFLHHLLPGSCRLIICPARSPDGMRVPAVWQKAISAERMLLLSPFRLNRSAANRQGWLNAETNWWLRWPAKSCCCTPRPTVTRSSC